MKGDNDDMDYFKKCFDQIFSDTADSDNQHPCEENLNNLILTNGIRHNKCDEEVGIFEVAETNQKKNLKRKILRRDEIEKKFRNRIISPVFNKLKNKNKGTEFYKPLKLISQLVLKDYTKCTNRNFYKETYDQDFYTISRLAMTNYLEKLQKMPITKKNTIKLQFVSTLLSQPDMFLSHELVLEFNSRTFKKEFQNCMNNGLRQDLIKIVEEDYKESLDIKKEALLYLDHLLKNYPLLVEEGKRKVTRSHQLKK